MEYLVTIASVPECCQEIKYMDINKSAATTCISLKISVLDLETGDIKQIRWPLLN